MVFSVVVCLLLLSCVSPFFAKFSLTSYSIDVYVFDSDCFNSLTSKLLSYFISILLPSLLQASHIMKILVQNLQKKAGLGGKLINEHQPDIFLAQEVSLSSEAMGLFGAEFTSNMGYGTAIYCREGVSSVERVLSPVAEMGGFIKKKTTLALCMGVQCVSFHGYNGSPHRDVASLVEHVKAVARLLKPDTPAIFAGDFNTWTTDHLLAVQTLLRDACGFHLAHSWPYPNRAHPLDHVFLRGLRLVELPAVFESEADHKGVIMNVEQCLPSAAPATASPVLQEEEARGQDPALLNPSPTNPKTSCVLQ